MSTEGVVPVDPSGRPAGMRNRLGYVESVPDWRIKASIAGLYLERKAAGGRRPTTAELHERCGTKSARVAQLAKAMRESGDLPDLPTSPGQRGGEARATSIEKVRAERRTPFRGPDMLRRRVVPVAGKPGPRRELPYRLWPVVVEVTRAERRIGIGKGVADG